MLPVQASPPAPSVLQPHQYQHPRHLHSSARPRPNNNAAAHHASHTSLDLGSLDDQLTTKSAAAATDYTTDSEASMSIPSASRFAAGFAPYTDGASSSSSSAPAGRNLLSPVGEDKMAAKLAYAASRHPHHPHHQPSAYSRLGLLPVVDDAEPTPLGPHPRSRGPRPMTHGTTPSPSALPAFSEKARSKYDSLIPETRPPTSVFEHAARIASNEVLMLLFYMALSLFTRLYRIGRSNTVIWDEAHFGKFGSHYLKGEFYFDVHPPLGKMLVALAGLLSGYNGSFDFKSGTTYPEDVNYVGMRVMLAMFGVAMVPIAWSTSGALGWNWRSRHALAIMVLVDNAWLVISRFILLDSMLLFFTFTTVHGLVMFHRQQAKPFTDMWWFWLGFTGLSIGCNASVKWVGLFATALVGIYTVEDLWDRFGDLRMPVRQYARHWCARILALICVPLAVYMISFKLHFAILSHSGPGDAQMSSLFQAHLRGNDFASAPLEAAYGSAVTFKNMGYGGGLLHSHVQTYPTGSGQQQVTCYHYKDDNNDFIITPLREDPQLPGPNETTHEAPRMLKNGETIRLVHAATRKNLHSHPVPAPVTKENYEVSGYGNDTIGDHNDYWVVEAVDDLITGKKALPGDSIKSLVTRMRFRHASLNCYLRAANAVLPQWGWKQIEVSCDKENNPRDDHTYWNIESHWNDRLPAGNTKLYRSPFIRDFIHLNVAMMTSNNALIPDADKEDILASKPLEWPWLWNGLRMNGWGDDSTKYYLVGNPVIWWSSTLSLFAFVGLLAWYLGRLQRRIPDLSPQQFNQFVFVGKVAGLGWLLHYVPFLIMARVTYIHHHLPTLYFQVIMLVHLLDHFLWSSSSRLRLSPMAKNATLAIVLLAVVGAFWWLRGTVYGFEGPISKHHGIRWRKSWNIQ